MKKNAKSTLPDVFLESSQFRGNDIYLPEMNWEELVVEFYPADTSALMQSLSNITSAFYGNMLRVVGLKYGMDKINSTSKETIYSLGRDTAKRYLSNKEIEKNAKGIVNIILASVFTANPEYQFEIIELSVNKASLFVCGTDRYHKIAVAQGIENHIIWPVIGEFIQAINDEMELNYQVDIILKKLDESSRCLYEVSITQR